MQNNSPRTYSPVDQLLINIDRGLRTVFGKPQVTERPNPADNVTDDVLSEQEKISAACLMRINHSGEVAAQGLYQGQAITAKLPEVREKMERAALEENDHLAWCAKRLYELNSHTSYLNPLWYAGSVTIGALAGLAGDKWSLGFVAETEHQVVEHLESHLTRLPEKDLKSRAILEQMKEDEGRHATVALGAGGAQLPSPIKILMRAASRIMTSTANRI